MVGTEALTLLRDRNFLVFFVASILICIPLLHLLGNEGTTALQERLHAPVGLNLGGRGPEALALAIAAELLQHFSQQR